MPDKYNTVYHQLFDTLFIKDIDDSSYIHHIINTEAWLTSGRRLKRARA